jgi:outer membrane protein OmpA-like peptidoglycan-associated protein
MVKSFQRALGAASVLFLAPVLVLGSGCATKGFVKSQTAAANQYTDTQVGEAKSELQGGIDQAQRRADEAMDKATLAEQIASGAVDFDEIATYQVTFAFDGYELNDEAMMELDALGGRLSSYPGYVLEIRGYADATGSDRYNYRLGRERAESVQRYLMARYSVPAARVALVSFGEEEPVAENSSMDGRAQNRRVQVRLLDMKPKEGKPLASDV